MSQTFSFPEYAKKFSHCLLDYDWSRLDGLAEAITECWIQRKKVSLCGNGGSAANAMHLANNFLYRVNPEGRGLKVISMADNASVITCLANDTGYDNIYSR